MFFVFLSFAKNRIPFSINITIIHMSICVIVNVIIIKVRHFNNVIIMINLHCKKITLMVHIN